MGRVIYPIWSRFTRFGSITSIIGYEIGYTQTLDLQGFRLGHTRFTRLFPLLYCYTHTHTQRINNGLKQWANRVFDAQSLVLQGFEPTRLWWFKSANRVNLPYSPFFSANHSGTVTSHIPDSETVLLQMMLRGIQVSSKRIAFSVSTSMWLKQISLHPLALSLI